MEIKISCKSASRKRNIVEQVSYYYEKVPQTVRELIEETVKIMELEFKERQENSEILRFLSEEEIEQKAESGKIGFDVIYNEKRPDLEKAINNAVQCFEDGIVVIFVDQKKKEHLEDRIDLKECSEVAIMRLTMLCGRMW